MARPCRRVYRISLRNDKAFHESAIAYRDRKGLQNSGLMAFRHVKRADTKAIHGRK
jgi:hypothetical protein